ncbi:GerAB/ArcD/ProY family transporter [Brevibacillus sp. SYSU BS000544]|uniref:GerAB/ArcD/ProY family transporter n=1 Tax=Brevibacillus sp. SYSU BS000544 TaxID=3416443 RepID=UPI003CE48016
MKNNDHVNSVPAFNAYLLFFIIPAIQIGVGAMGFQSTIYEKTGHDAWISVIIAGIAAQISTWIVIRTLLRFPKKDLYDIHELILGKWLGKIMNIVYLVYLFLIGFTILRNYIDVIQTWLFPEMKSWTLAFLLVLLILYGVMGGIRVIVGYCVLSCIFSIWLFFLIFYGLKYSTWDQLFPIMEAKVGNLLNGAFQMSFTVLGFEILYFILPFIKEQNRAQKYSQFGLIFTTVTYIGLMIAAIVYYSGPQLIHVTWATLNMYKIVELPFLERFEFLAVSYWVLVITPNCLLYLWAATRGIKKVFPFKQKYAVYFLCLVTIGLTPLFKTREQLTTFTEWVGQLGILLSFIYPFFLHLLVMLVQRQGRKKKNEQSA